MGKNNSSSNIFFDLKKFICFLLILREIKTFLQAPRSLGGGMGEWAGRLLLPDAARGPGLGLSQSSCFALFCFTQKKSFYLRSLEV